VGRLTWAGDTTPSHATLVAEIYVRPVRGRSSYLETTNCVTTTTFSAGDAADVTFSETRSGMAGPVRVLREPVLAGDPHDPATASGPLISELQRDRVDGYLASARANSSEGYPTLMLTTS
jgi:hypothetical protein